MSDDESNINVLHQGLVSGREDGYRRGPEESESSHLSDLAGLRRRARGTQGSETSQAEGSDRKMRRVYPKVRTGCDTCKNRKIKCDETKPICRNCTKSGRKCLGYHPPQAKIFESLSGMHRSDSDMEHEARATEHFKNETAVRLASYRPLQLNLEFWQSVVPTLAAESPPVRHAMLTLSATQEEYESEASDLMSTEWSKSLRQHTRAVRELWSGIAAASISNEATLICCLLLTLYDIWHFGLPLSFTHIFGGFQHVFGGLNVCKFIRKTSPSKSPLPETTEINGAMMIPAYQFLADCAFVLLDDTDEEQTALLQEFTQTLDPVLPGHFAHPDEAVSVMDRALRQIAKLQLGLEGPDLNRLELHLASVLSTLQHSLSMAQARNDTVAVNDFRTLLVHHRAALVLLSGFDSGSETVYNGHLTDFEFIVEEMEDLLQAGSAVPQGVVRIGIVPPLFLTATKCRDNLIRKRALTAMHQSPHYEHLWTSCTAHQIAQRVVWLEEASRNTCVRLQSIRFDAAQNQIELKYDIQNIGSTKSEESTFVWGRGSDIEASEPPESFDMPQKMLQACGYSAPILTIREITCHCDLTAPV